MRLPRVPPRPTTSEERAALQGRWDARWTPFLVVSALLPMVGAASDVQLRPATIAIGVATWLVFVVDLVVHMWLQPGYLRTRSGVFDLAIVVLTAPWYLVLGSTGSWVTLARLARLVRILWVAVARGRRVRRLAERLGTVGLYAGALVVGCALVEKWTEPPSAGFTTYGDAFWWAVVTLTTVGYGDIVPVGGVGRVVAAILMLGGVAFLGTLAAALASFFGFQDPEPDDKDPDGEGNAAGPTGPRTSTAPGPGRAPAPSTAPGPTVVADGDVAAQVAALSDEVSALRALLERDPAP